LYFFQPHAAKVMTAQTANVKSTSIVRASMMPSQVFEFRRA
jgi:hypothetical protein